MLFQKTHSHTVAVSLESPSCPPTPTSYNSSFSNSYQNRFNTRKTMKEPVIRSDQCVYYWYYIKYDTINYV